MDLQVHPTRPASAGVTRELVLTNGEVSTTAGQIARYGGGTRYRPDDRMHPVIQEALEMANKMVRPTGWYRFDRVVGIAPGGRHTLASGHCIGLPEPGGIAPPEHLMAVVATLGGDLEEKVARLAEAGEFLLALYLNSAAAGLLEALDQAVFARIKAVLKEQALYIHSRVGPGLNGVPMELQQELFAFIDPERVGVRLNSYMIMKPGQSISYVLRVTSHPEDGCADYKCRYCDMPNCRFRIGSEPSGN